MQKNRYSKRAGYGPLRGATNPRMSVSATAPSNPINLDIWLDISSSPAVLKYWDDATSTWKT